MKIKKIIDLIKKSGVLAIYEGKDCQWLSDGHATYPVTDLPEICSVTLCAMYDITAKQADKLRIIDRIALPTTCNYADTVENEKIIPECPIEIIVGDKRLIAYATSQGIAFLDKRYLAPFSDMDENMLRVYERYTADGDLYFVVKNGFMLVGIIEPAKVINVDFVASIKSMATACEIALQNVKEEV